MKNEVEATTTDLSDGGSTQDEVASSNDENILLSLGHKQELKRTHTFWSLMAYQTTILCSWSCNIVMYYYVFSLGGPTSLVWGTILVAFGQLAVMASMAEYCSLWPTAGGQQFYTYLVAPPSIRRFMSYVVGWCVLVGEIASSTSCALNSAQLLAAFVEVAHPDLAWKTYMTWLIYTLFLIGPTLSNLAPQYLPALTYIGASFNILGGLTWAIVFLVMAPKQSAEFVFTTFINTSGWKSSGWVFILSMYVPIYGIFGTDGVMHLAEEMKNAARDAPRVMIWSMVWASVTAWLSAVVMCFTVGPNWALYLDASQPYLAWFMDATNSVYGGGVFCAILMMGLNYLVIVNMNTAASRLMWSMARDSAFPFSAYFAQISGKFQVPVRALVAITVLMIAIGLMVLGSDLAFYAFISGGGVALQISYCVPILCVVCRGRAIMPARPNFDLGRWGLPINIVALAWSVLAIIFYVTPQYVPVIGDIANMNWSIAIIAVVVIFAGVYWLLKGRKEYLVASNTLLDDVLVVTADGIVSGRDVVAATEKSADKQA